MATIRNSQKLQKDIWKNKVDKKFNTTNIPLEFSFLYGEVAEAFQAYRKKLPDLGEELADVAIYLFGIAEMLKIDLGKEIVKKVEKNKKRKYKKVRGVNVRPKD
ncbi:MAG: hypothetical protein WC608_01515 [Parcubacteria group bacterium]